jgi:hypothetical protein
VNTLYSSVMSNISMIINADLLAQEHREIWNNHWGGMIDLNLAYICEGCGEFYYTP